MTEQVIGRLAEIRTMDIVALKAMWRELFAAEPPPYNRRFLESRLAYRVQELAYGGLKPETIARWTARQGRDASRALGWDTPSAPSSAGRFFSPRSFGHTGFTGTSMWMDPERGLFVIILANRVNSRGMSTTHVAMRRDIANAVQRAILDAPLVTWEAPRPPR